MIDVREVSLTLVEYETVIVRDGEVVYRHTFLPEDKAKADADYERIKRHFCTRRRDEEVGLIHVYA